MDRRSYLFNCL